ncbi:hypothetical protein ACOMHN_041964 [Nucella lapillus]
MTTTTTTSLSGQDSNESWTTTTTTTTTSDDETPTTETPWTTLPLYTAGQYLWFVCPPVILLLGAFGNVITIVIMRRMTSAESPINIYFSATAVVDLIYLFTSILSKWVRYTLGFRIETTHSVVCKVYIWVYTGCGTIGGWYLVCMSVHRAMSVVWPHRVNVLCTRRTVRLLLAGVTVFFAVLYSHYLFGLERRQFQKGSSYVCIMNTESYFHFVENVFVYIDLAVYCILPFVCLALSNSVLVWKLTTSVKEAGKHLTQGNVDQVQARERSAKSVTLTVIVVSTAFLVLTLPTSVSFIVDFFAVSYAKVSGYERAQKFFTSAACTLLGHLNSAINFYLYCLTGRRFREEFVKMMMCCGRSRRQSRAAMSAVKEGD